MTQPHIVVIGSSNTDLVIRSARLPRPGETVRGEAFQIFAGGKGANQAVAAARAGARVTLVANIGGDDFGDAAVKRLRAEGIDTRRVVRSGHQPSGVAIILVDSQGENLISVARGSNDELLSEHVDAALPAIRRARCLLMQLEFPLITVRRATELAVQHNVPVLLNPAPARAVSNDLLRKATFLTPNERELAALTRLPARRRSEVETAVRQLRSRGVRNVLATCGGRGVCWCGAEGIRWFHTPKVRAVDTVGAGDCFSGSFAAAIAEGRPIEEAIRFAVTAASISVTRPGAQASMPHRREILNALRSGS